MINKKVLVESLYSLETLCLVPVNAELIARFMFSDYLGHFIIENPYELQLIR